MNLEVQCVIQLFLGAVYVYPEMSYFFSNVIAGLKMMKHFKFMCKNSEVTWVHNLTGTDLMGAVR